MEMVKRPVLIVTQEEDLEEEIRNEVHPSLELKSVWNAERPKLLARHDSHDAFVDAFSYLRVEHLGIELVFGGRKFWLMKVHRVPASLNSPTLTGLYVWELKTFEGQAVLVCRGMYSAGKRFWGHLKKSAEVGAKQSFMFRAKQDPVSGADIFHAWKANPSTFVAPTDSQPWRTSLANAGLRPDANSRFVYRPIRGSTKHSRHGLPRTVPPLRGTTWARHCSSAQSIRTYSRSRCANRFDAVSS